MHPLSFKLIFFTVFLCFFQAYGGDDKSAKLLKSDLKAKLAKSEEASSSLESTDSTESKAGEKLLSIFGISVPPEDANDTVEFDQHTYYNSTFYVDPEKGEEYWINMLSYPETIIHTMLSNSHRQATTVTLKFDFPFYGSILNNVTIATGGFLYMGDYLHNWIAATQYVAPLMANFDTSQSPDSIIKYADNGTAFTVEWDKVYIKNKMEDGAFTFQVTLLKSGDIIFAYKDIPYPVANISDSSHPVKIGISDAYVIERSLFFVRRKTIYEYHRIDMLKKSISNNTALFFTALPTCLNNKDYNSCAAANPDLKCMWCQPIKRCSDGVDRQRQSWIDNHCSIHAEIPPVNPDVTTTDKSGMVETSSKTSLLTSPNAIETSTKHMDKSPPSKDGSTYNVDLPPVNHNGVSPNNPQEAEPFIQEKQNESASGISIGAIVTIVAFIAGLIGATTWVIYAYKFPQSSSGQFLIKYRPSQWTIKKEDNSIVTNSRHL